MSGSTAISTFDIAEFRPLRKPKDGIQQLGGLDVLKHLLAIFVVIQHTWSATRYPSEMKLGYEHLTDIINGAVFGFFLISGFFFKAPKKNLTFIQRKAQRLLIPFFLFSILYGIIFIVAFGVSPEKLIFSTITLQGNSMQLYFLPYLFVVDITVGMLFSLRSSRPFAILLLALACCITITLLLPTASSTGANPKLFPYYGVAYLLGMAIARYPKAAGLIFFILFLVVGFLYDPRFLDAALMVFLFAVFLNAFKFLKLRIPGSGAVYILHTPFLNFSVSFLLMYFGINNWYNLIFTIISTYVLCIFLFLVFVYAFPKQRKLILE
ncbi:acyltransferase family protein [uncultured Martelella sp.]|uniref:acyltransferase family protein n=1 Tax=uncultured Martelella sp. TaxID=392331 RepID=UPI0029C7FD8E|nr:acyltransferase family protein [uncultured Martelella sp.]